MKKLAVLLSLTLLIILTNSANAIFPLTCGEITTPGVYTLSGHLTSDGSSGESGINPTACVNITTNDVVLNCAGYRINYSSFNATEIGIATNSSNVTLQNCELGEGIDGFSAYSILVNNSGNEIQNITIYNVTVNGTEGIYLNNVTNANLTLITVRPTNTPAIGIELGANGVYNSTLTDITGNTSTNGAKLIYALRSNNVNITNFTGYVNAGGAATALTSQSNLTVTNMTGSHYGNSGSVIKINDGTTNLYNSGIYGQFTSIPAAHCAGGRLNAYNTIFNSTGGTAAINAQCPMTLETITITYGNLTIGNASNVTLYNSTLSTRNITAISESSSNLYVIQPLNVTTTNLDANVTVTNYSIQSLNTTTKSALFNITALRVNSTGTFNFSNVTINATNSTATNQTYLILQAPYQGAYQTSTIALTIPDTTAPVITINLPVNNTNQTSATLTINFSVTDETALHSCWYSINKTTNVSVAGCVNATTNQTTATITTGTNQNITIYANDTSGNLASTMYTFTRDTTAPQITAVTNSSTSSSGFTIAWTTNEPANSTLKYGDTTALLDGTSSNSENDTAHSRSASGLDSSTLYYYNVTSCDTSGNCNTTGPYTITTSAASSTTSSSGGSSGASASTTSATNNPTIALTIAENKVGTLPDFDSHKETRRTQIGDKGILLYTHQKEQHRIQVKKIETGKVTLTLASTPFDVTLATGEEKTYDVTGDKQDDIKLKLISITGKNIVLDITQYTPPKATTPTTVKTTAANATNTNNTNSTDLAQNIVLPNTSQLPLIPIAVVVIVIIAGLVYWKTRTAAPKYPLARKPPGKKLF